MHPSDYIMDPAHYDRIADLLCQIRAKIENNLKPKSPEGKIAKQMYFAAVLDLLKETDLNARWDKTGRM